MLTRHSKLFNLKILSIAIVLATLAASMIATGQVSKLANAMSTNAQSSTSTGLYFDHVLLVMMENQNINSTYNCGSQCSAFLTPFANSNGLALNYVRVQDGSLPNYFALTMGQINQNPFPGADCSPHPGDIRPDGTSNYCPQNSVNIVDRLESAGLTWKDYQENYPGSGSGSSFYSSGGCYIGYSKYQTGNEDATYYAADHNPFVYYTDIASSSSRCANIVPANSQHANPETDDLLLSDLNSANAPNFIWVTPDECDQMHHACSPYSSSDNAGAIQQGSNYLSQLIPQILNSYTFKNTRSAIFITFDENCAIANPPGCGSTNRIYTVWTSHNSQNTNAGYKSNTPYNHYSFMRTIEANWNLPTLTTNDANAKPMIAFLTNNPPPTLSTSFTHNPPSPQVGQQVSFTASGSGGTSPYSFGWTFGDGTNGTGATQYHAYSTAATYTVVLTTKDSGTPQQTATSQQSVTVTQPSPTTLTASFTYSPSSPAKGQPLTFTGSAIGGTSPYSYSWSFGDGSSGTGSTVTHTYSSVGAFSVTLTVKDSGSPQQTTSSQQSITVSNPPPTLTASFSYSPTTPQVGQQVAFAASASGGTAPYSYSWTFGDGSSGTGSTATDTYQTAKTFTATVTITDASGQIAKSSQTITVNAPLSASFAYSPTNPIPLQTVTFTASATGGSSPYTYGWDFGDASTGSGSSVSHSYLLPGTYTVVLTVTDASGNTITVSETITVNISL